MRRVPWLMLVAALLGGGSCSSTSKTAPDAAPADAADDTSDAGPDTTCPSVPPTLVAGRPCAGALTCEYLVDCPGSLVFACCGGRFVDVGRTGACAGASAGPFSCPDAGTSGP